MKTIKFLPKEVLSKELLANYDLIILPVTVPLNYINKNHLIVYENYKIPNVKLRTGMIKIIANKTDIMLVGYSFKNKKYKTIVNKMVDIIKLNEYKNVLLFIDNLLTVETYLLLKNFVNNNVLDIDIIS